VNSSPLIDSFGRIHTNLRISVTDRCNVRCFYCMPEEGVKFVPRDEILSFEEIERFARIAVGLGIDKVRVTGGEPLAELAGPLYEAGLRRLNVHLDTLDRQRFRQISRRDELDKVLEGIAVAKRLGFGPIKLNAVAVKNLVEPDLVPLARFGRENGFEVRFIEFMPLDAQHLWERGKVLSAGDIVATLSREIAPLIPIPDADPRAPALEYQFADGIGRVGFIASVSRPFCMNCNRLRLTADGKVRYCLFAIEEDDVKGMLRGGAPDEEIAALIRRNVAGKWEGHEINTSRFVAPPRPMYAIGG
jgi:cyclic pyranopterin phosphate synthase